MEFINTLHGFDFGNNTTPQDTPVIAPGATPVPAPGDTPVIAPGATPAPAPWYAPVLDPGATSVIAPGDTPVIAPGATPVLAPGDTPVIAPGDTPQALPSGNLPLPSGMTMQDIITLARVISHIEANSQLSDKDLVSTVNPPPLHADPLSRETAEMFVMRDNGITTRLLHENGIIEKEKK